MIFVLACFGVVSSLVTAGVVVAAGRQDPSGDRSRHDREWIRRRFARFRAQRRAAKLAEEPVWEALRHRQHPLVRAA